MDEMQVQKNIILLKFSKCLPSVLNQQHATRKKGWCSTKLLEVH